MDKHPTTSRKLKHRIAGAKGNIRLRPVLFVLVFAIIGAALLINIFAATPTAFFEAEAGTKSASITTISDAQASGGSAIQFNQAASPPPATGYTLCTGRDANGGVPAGTYPHGPCTGVPAGVTLTIHNGDMTINTAGTVVDAREITGRVFVNAANVTIKRTAIRYDIRSNSTGLLIEDVELGYGSVPGDPERGGTAVGDGGYTCRRCNMHGFADGLRSGNNRGIVVEDSWIHDLALPAGAHNDGIQRYAPATTAHDTIRHNFINCFAWPNASSSVACTTAAIFYADDWRGTVLIENNLLAGGGVTMRIHESGTATVRGNRFVRCTIPSCGGPTYNAFNTGFAEWSDNRWVDTGQIINP